MTQNQASGDISKGREYPEERTSLPCTRWDPPGCIAPAVRLEVYHHPGLAMSVTGLQTQVVPACACVSLPTE